jgi:hypothetical protein
MRVFALTCALLVLGAGVASADEPSRFFFDAEAGAFPITATSGDWSAPQAKFIVSRRPWDDNNLHIDVEQAWTHHVVELFRHDGDPITTGTYNDQKALVISKGLGCYDNAADFTIDRLDLDEQGIVLALDGSVEHRCGDKPDNAFRAKIHYVRGA